MKQWFLLFVATIIVCACNPNEGAARLGNLTESLTIVTATGDKHEFEVELALSAEQQRQGLMNRSSLPEDGGMLFWFGGEEVERSFWMKNTLIPLDLIFIRLDGTIHHIHHNAIPYDLSPIPSNGAVAAVLEIKGGMSKNLGIQIGDHIKQRFFK